jgi:ADP-ribose pyrophosphatase YjhB (NUDIX family)
MTQRDSFAKFRDGTGKPLQKMPDEIRPSTNGFILNARGEVLLQRRSDNGFWGLPGGRVDIGESVEQGVIREVFEETGLRVRMKRLVGIYSDPNLYSIMSYPNGWVTHYVTLVFECQRQSGRLRISDESTDIGHFPPDALPEDTLLSHSLRIKDALANQAKPFIR